MTYKYNDAEERECHTRVSTIDQGTAKVGNSPPLVSSKAEADKPHKAPEAISNGIHKN